MNQRPDVSVIVPCYNAQRFLSVCLESLKAQKAPEIEMIFIDDGSTDETGAMLDQFAKTEPRARVVHRKNGGVSSARNKGLSMAQGRYIAFMDADDALEEVPGRTAATPVLQGREIGAGDIERRRHLALRHAALPA